MNARNTAGSAAKKFFQIGGVGVPAAENYRRVLSRHPAALHQQGRKRGRPRRFRQIVGQAEQQPLRLENGGVAHRNHPVRLPD